MTVSDSDERRVVLLLCRDIAATLGPGHEATVRAHAERIREFSDGRSAYVDKVVEDVQQEFHDLFVHTTWPPCPFHSRHPLWLHDQAWICEETGMQVARLGALGEGIAAVVSRRSHDNHAPEAS